MQSAADVWLAAHGKGPEMADLLSMGQQVQQGGTPLGQLGASRVGNPYLRYGSWAPNFQAMDNEIADLRSQIAKNGHDPQVAATYGKSLMNMEQMRAAKEAELESSGLIQRRLAP